MKTNSLLLAVIVFIATFDSVWAAAPSGASLRTTLHIQNVEECGCPAFVLSAEVTPYYSYRIQWTTNLNMPIHWIDEPGTITATESNFSLAMPLETTGSKFFRVVELGQAPHVIALPADTYVPATIIVDVVPDPNNTLNGAGIQVGDGGLDMWVEDSAHNYVPSERGPLDLVTFILAE